MPRVEIIPKDWETSKEKAQGDGTPTIDVCTDCHLAFFSGCETDPLEPEGGACDELADLIKQFPGSTIGSTEVEHPTFGGEGYPCEICTTALTEEDD